MSAWELLHRVAETSPCQELKCKKALVKGTDGRIACLVLVVGMKDGPEAIFGNPVLVLVVDHFPNARLYYELGALVAGEHGDVNGGSCQCRRVLGVQNRISLGMDHIGVLGFQFVSICSLFCPRQFSIMAPSREPIVANAQNDLVSSDYASPYL